MLSRIAGRALTSGPAFFLAAVVDLTLFALGSLWQRYARRREKPWPS
jgi:hypothetical protein